MTVVSKYGGERCRQFALAGTGCFGVLLLWYSLHSTGQMTASPTSLPTIILYIAIIAGLVFQCPRKSSNSLPGFVKLLRAAYIGYVAHYVSVLVVLYAVQDSGCAVSWLTFILIYGPLLTVAIGQALYPWSDLANEATELSSAVACCEAHVLAVIEGSRETISASSLEMESTDGPARDHRSSSSTESLLALLHSSSEHESELEHVGSIFRQLVQVLDEFSVRITVPAMLQVLLTASCFVVDVVLWEQGLKHHGLDVRLVCFDSPITYIFPSRCSHPKIIREDWIATYLEISFIVIYAMQVLASIASAMCVTQRAAKLREKIALSQAAFRPSGCSSKGGCDSVDVLCILNSFDARPIGVRVCGALVTPKAAAYILAVGGANCAARLLVA